MIRPLDSCCVQNLLLFLYFDCPVYCLLRRYCVVSQSMCAVWRCGVAGLKPKMNRIYKLINGHAYKSYLKFHNHNNNRQPSMCIMTVMPTHKMLLIANITTKQTLKDQHRTHIAMALKRQWTVFRLCLLIRIHLCHVYGVFFRCHFLQCIDLNTKAINIYHWTWLIKEKFAFCPPVHINYGNWMNQV